MSIIFMLLALPAEAKVYAAVVSRDLLTGILTGIPANLKNLKTLLDANDQTIPTLFQKGDFALPVDKELIILGPRTAVKNELLNYPHSNVTTTDPSITAYGCNHPKEHLALVEIRSATFGVGGCASPFTKILQHDLKKVDLLQVAICVEAMKK